jgi:N-succinyldiaminopimelate aminotransferase
MLCQFCGAEITGIRMVGRAGNPVFAGQGTTIFTVMSALASEHDAINLGQGFPDEDGPASIREVAATALRDGPNQYPPMAGLGVLRSAVAAHDLRFYDMKFDPEREVVITSGATEALADSIMALARPGDEAVIVEPAYDSYRPILEAMGANVKSVRLEPPHFRLSAEMLERVFSERTKLVVVNSPLNPAGRVFDRDELQLIATFLERYDAYAVCDEVYEHLAFGRSTHLSLASLPNMRDRCLRVGSAGKMFSLTGWKVGWVVGPEALMKLVTNAHQFNTFTTSPALQLGVAHGLDREMDFTLSLREELQGKRDYLSAALKRIGFEIYPCEGTYFLTADASKLTKESDRAMCERLTRDAGVAAIPFSPFYGGDAPAGLIRFAFCKRQAVLEEAVRRLETYFAPVGAK